MGSWHQKRKLTSVHTLDEVLQAEKENELWGHSFQEIFGGHALQMLIIHVELLIPVPVCQATESFNFFKHLKPMTWKFLSEEAAPICLLNYCNSKCLHLPAKQWLMRQSGSPFSNTGLNRSNIIFRNVQTDRAVQKITCFKLNVFRIPFPSW